MDRLPLRRLFVGPRPAPDRIFYSNVWFSGGHNNARYSELLPRLRRLDRYLLAVPAPAPARFATYRLLRATRPQHDAALLAAAARRYRWMFSTDPEQTARFRGKVVVDVDDPAFTEREAALLDRPNVEAFVVTAETALTRLRALGVSSVGYVVPQGTAVGAIDPALVDEVAAAHRRDGEVVVGYMAAWLLTGDDRGGTNPLYNVDHLLDLWDDIRPRVPDARLWLVGGAGARLRRRLAGRDDVLLLGRVDRPAMLAHVRNFDIALYPRTKDQGVRAAKIADYLGAGVPTVSYAFDVTADVAEAGAGVLVDTRDEFVDAVARLAHDDAARGRLAAAAAAAGAARDWDRLAADYQQILDRHLA